MSGRQTIKQRISFEGGEAMKAQLQALGEVGEKAFKKISAATRQAEFAKVGASLKRVGDDLAMVGRRLTLAFSAITAVASAAGSTVLVMAKSAAVAADAAGKAAQAAGLQVDAYGRMAYAAKLADLSQEELGGSLSRLNKAMAAAASGSKNEADLFKRLGVSLRDAKGQLRPTEAVMQDVAEAFKRMPDGAKKSALAIELFGKSGAKMLPFLNAGKQGLIDLGKEAERLGIVFTKEQVAIAEEMNDTLTGLGKAINGVRLQFGLLFAPSITVAAKALRDVIARNRAAIIDFTNNAIRQATVLVRDFFAALSGRDADVENKWIIDWRDGIIQFGRDFIAVVNGVLLPSFGALRDAAKLVTDALNSIFGTSFTAGQAALLAGVINLVGGFRLLWSTIGLAVSAVRVLFGLAMANPWVAAITVVAGGLALWATRADAATSAMEKHRGVVDSVAEAYRKAGGEVAKMAKEERDRALNKAREELKETGKALTGALDEVKAKLLQFEGMLPKAADPIFELVRRFADGKISIEQFQAAVDELASGNSALAKLSNQIADLTAKPRELSTSLRETKDWIALLAGETTDAGFQATKTGESFRGLAANAASMSGDLKGAGAAAADASGKAENLNRTITVTKFGAEGPVKQVFELANGVARAVDQSKTQLDGLGQSAAQAGEKTKSTFENVGESVTDVGSKIQKTSAQLAAQAADFDAAVPFEDMAQGIQEVSVAALDVATKVKETATATTQSLQEIGTNAKTVAADAAAGTAVIAESIKLPFEQLPTAISAIMAGIRSPVQVGFESIMSLARSLTSEIQQMISSILAALQRAAAEAARLRAAAGSSGGSSARVSPRNGFAGGGAVFGAGTSKSDSILARLSNGEFVIQAAAVRKFGLGFFDMLNRGLLPAFKGFSAGGFVDSLNRSMAIPRYASGGLVGAALGGGAGAMKSFDLHIHNGGETRVFQGVMAPAEVATAMQKFAVQSARSSAGRKPGWRK